MNFVHGHQNIAHFFHVIFDWKPCSSVSMHTLPSYSQKKWASHEENSALFEVVFNYCLSASMGNSLKNTKYLNRCVCALFIAYQNYLEYLELYLVRLVLTLFQYNNTLIMQNKEHTLNLWQRKQSQQRSQQLNLKRRSKFLSPHNCCIKIID